MNAEEIVRKLAACDEPMADLWCALCSEQADPEAGADERGVIVPNFHAEGCAWRMAREYMAEERLIDMEEAERAARLSAPGYDYPSGMRVGSEKDPYP
jgi:hypothetical protein